LRWSGGRNIYPADIEAVLKTHPAVFECAVIGIPHPTWGETPLGLVVPRPGQEGIEAEAQRSWANVRLGRRAPGAGATPRGARSVFCP
jgi:long-chain acyl-CoA synthetase